MRECNGVTACTAIDNVINDGGFPRYPLGDRVECRVQTAHSSYPLTGRCLLLPLWNCPDFAVVHFLREDWDHDVYYSGKRLIAGYLTPNDETKGPSMSDARFRFVAGAPAGVKIRNV